MKISVGKGNGKDLVDFEVVEVNSLAGIVETITKNNYSLGTFTDNYRNNKNFQGSDFVGLDFDEGMSLAEAELMFAEHEHIIATTRSHQKQKGEKPPCDRFRVILRTDRFIDNKEDYKATVLSLLNEYPDADRACSDAARFFYPSGKIISMQESGKKVGVVKYTKPEIESREDVPKFIKGELSKLTLDFIAFGAAEGAWNHRLFKAAVDCHEQQYSIGETTKILRGATLNFDGDFDESDIKTIQSAFEREPKHAPRGIEDMLDLKHPLDIAKESRDVSWLADGLFMDGSISLMVGAPKSGKSTLTRQLAMAVSRGGEFLGRKVKKGKVIYLALEENESLLGEQLKKLGLTTEDNIMMKVGPIFKDNPDQLLKRSIEATGATLVIIDTMLLMTGIEDINNYNQVYKSLSPYRDMARETGCHITMIHHKNKGQSTRADAAAGSSGLSGAVDCTFVLNETNNPEFRFINTSQRGGNPFTNQKIKYIKELDRYEISNETYQGDF